MIVEMGGNSEEARINMRTRQVHDRYRQVIEAVYPGETGRLHLEHTNKVIIKDEKVIGRNGSPIKVRKLIVYVDDSLFLAELNAQRELIKLRLLELFGEEIEDFDIRVSGRREYREVHPFVDEDSTVNVKNPATIPLTPDEKSFVSRTASVVEDETVQKALEKAMTADLEWKKGENMEKSRENTK